MKQIILWTSLVLVAYISVACETTSPCDEQVKTQVKSPDSELSATISERNCGATADFSTVVSIKPDDKPFQPDAGVVFLTSGRPQINLIWENASTLKVECKDCLADKVFRRETKSNGVTIVY